MPVIGHHLIWTAYGTWLPNDPRGSGSHNVYTAAIAELGRPHYGRKRQQPSRSAVRTFYEEATPRLQFPIIRFGATQIAAIADTFASIVQNRHYTCYACAVMPDHVHLVIRKHRHRSEEMIERFQTESRSQLIASKVVPPDHPLWTKGGWKLFLHTPEEVWTRIRTSSATQSKKDFRREAGPSSRSTTTGHFTNSGANPQVFPAPESPLAA